MHLSTLLLPALVHVAAAHPGEHHEEETDHVLLARREHQAAARRGLEACSSKRSFQDLQARALLRRSDTAFSHRKTKRASATGTGHNLTDSEDISANSDNEDVFGDSHTCVLNPEGETGPYYVKGELIRENLREDQPGVPIVIEGQFIDVETCEPITDLYWDVWNCNATGVYSGLIAQGNGNTDDTSNLDATFLRGIQKTDDDGVVKFLSVFPGHYSGRTTHHHMVAWLNATVLPNNTLTSGYAGHIGQVFWDQDLINAVEATYPYNTNDVDITTNAEDRVVGDEVSDTDSDPFFNYVYLGDDLSDGIFGWLTIGINKSASYSPNYSFTYGEDGGTALESQVGSDNVNGGGAGGANGTMPTGTEMPSGMPSDMGNLGNASSVVTATPRTASGSTESSVATSTQSSNARRMAYPWRFWF